MGWATMVGRSSVQDFHFSSKSGGTGLSQERLLFQVSWRIILACMTAGVKSPRTSNTEVVVEAMVLFVTFVRSGDGGIATWRESDETSQWMPRAFGDWSVSGNGDWDFSWSSSGILFFTSG